MQLRNARLSTSYGRELLMTAEITMLVFAPNMVSLIVGAISSFLQSIWPLCLANRTKKARKA